MLERIDPSAVLSDEAVYREIDIVLTQIGKEEMLSLQQKERLRKALFDSLRGLDLLQELLEDPGVTEIMVNGPENIFIEREGKLLKWEKSFSEIIS